MNEGTPVAKELLLDLFEPDEGSVNFYYGRIGNGKTYSATADILHFLSQGRVVYANWHIDFSGFDERKSLIHVFWKVLFFRKRFFRFPKENFHYFSPDDVDVKFLGKLTDCEVFIDEGQWIFDSYKGTDFSVEKRKLILHTRHFNRSIVVVSQRPTAIHVSARANVNRFFRCERPFVGLQRFFHLLFFVRTEFQDMVNETVDEESDPVSTEWSMPRRALLNAYDTKYLRGGLDPSQQSNIEVFRPNYKEKLWMLREKIFSKAENRLIEKKIPLNREIRKLTIKQL